MSRKISIAIVVVALLALLGFGAWTVLFKPSGLPPEGFARGNGRIEADLVDVSPRLAGRVAEIRVREGDRVQPGDVLAVMDTAELESRLMQAEAAVASAEAAVGVAAAQVTEAEAKLALARSEQA
ncbi:biotin/lipoyl-binding protein, partial [Thiohalomonas denitrificans]|uniref:biotin/lipoyl-binding protein n=1 Tax=Thiohalomonas denitrificans TaxID=415747 RepID=UPI0026EA2FAB